MKNKDIILICEWFNHRVNERHEELVACQIENIKNPFITEIHYFLQHETERKEPRLIHPKVKWHYIRERPTFRDFFMYINNIHKKDTIYALANTDISFDDTIVKLWWVNWDNKFICLSRTNPPQTIHHPKWRPQIAEKAEVQFNHHQSHDVWITSGRIKDDLIYNCDFKLGVLGCDGKMALYVQWAKYDVKNYAFDICAYHNHMAGGFQGHRTYTKDDQLPKPYGEVPATYMKLSENYPY